MVKELTLNKGPSTVFRLKGYQMHQKIIAGDKLTQKKREALPRKNIRILVLLLYQSEYILTQKHMDNVPVLSDKDYQLLSKTYRRACELFYEDPKDQERQQTLILLTRIVPQVVPMKHNNNGLTIVSQMEILKAKAKSNSSIASSIEHTLAHLKAPKFIPIDQKLLIDVLEIPELFTVGLTILLRYWLVLKQQHNIDWKIVVERIASNIAHSPNLSIDILNEMTKNNDQNTRLIAKSGVIKYIFFNHIQATFKDKFNLYKAIKLIRTTATIEKSQIRDREPILAKVMQSYEEYVPIIADICSKCYDDNYCKDIMKKNIYDEKYIDYPYLWSHIQPFWQSELNQTNQAMIGNYQKHLNEKVSPSYEAKIFAIFNNYTKYCQSGSKDLIKCTPKHQQSLLNYLKLCISLTQNDPSTPHFIDWAALDNLIANTSNAKVSELSKYLKDSRSKQTKVGALSAHLRKVFSSEKNTDMMMERAAKVPKSDQQLDEIKDILSQKDRTTEVDTDNLHLAKEKALQSLRQAIAHDIKLDINSIIASMELTDVYLTTKMVQLVELYLMMFEEEIDNIDLKRIIEMISWIEDHYNGEIIDWGSISQLLLMLCEQDEWKRHLKFLNNHCFWLLSIQSLSEEDEQQLWDGINKHDPNNIKRKMPLIIGFLGKIITNPQRANFLAKHKKEIGTVVDSFMRNENYQINTMMLSYFLKGWGEQEQDYDPNKHKKAFEELIAPIDRLIASHTRLIPQEYYLLESCLPYRINTLTISADIESLIKSNGKLASHLFEQEKKRGMRKAYQGKISNISHESVESVHQSMVFGKKLPNLIKYNELNNLINYITKESQSYWQLYPRYSDIVMSIINILGATENESVQNALTELYEKLINQVAVNDNISDDQRQELYDQIKNSFEKMNQKGMYIEIERIKKVVTKIVEKEVREEIIIILNNYKVKEGHNIEMNIINSEEEAPEKKEMRTPQKPSKEEGPHKVNVSLASVMKNQRQVEYQKQDDDDSNQQSSIMMIRQSQKEQAYSSVNPFEHQYENMQKESQNISVFEVIKKVVSKQYDISRFYEIYDTLLQKTFTDSEKQLLGSLLVQLYHRHQCEKIMALFLNNQKVILSKEQIFELVSSHVSAFALSKRWKLLSKEYLNIAMKRVKQGFVCEGCQVASYNILKTLDLEYFYTQKHHSTVYELIQTVNLEDEVASLLSLIGMGARLPQIRTQWLSRKVHTKIMKFIKLFPKSIKIVGNLTFALSALTFEENDACLDIIKQTELIYLILDGVLMDPGNHPIAQYTSLFVGNLSFSKCFELHPNFNLHKVIRALKRIFEVNLQSGNFSPFKHLLKAFGNMSLLGGCSMLILDKQFCINLVNFSQKIDIITGYDQKKGKNMKLLLDLISNLAKNKDKLILLHQCKITLLTVTLLEIVEATHFELLASCIDSIDSICQDHNLQNWYVSEKKLPYILMDILKLQSEQKLIVKATRLITNLTLHSNCVPTILQSNILGVIANVVIPQLAMHDITKDNSESSKKIEVYIVKTLTRIYQSKQPLSMILKSGYLDCLVRMIEMADVNEFFLDILFHYSPHIPNFLSKRTFSSIIKILTVKVNDKDVLAKCIQSLKNILSFSYDVEQQDSLFTGIPEMYLKFLSTEYTADALFLMAYHLLRSKQFRQVLRKSDDKLQIIIKNLQKEEQYTDYCRAIQFLIYTPPIRLTLEDQKNEGQNQYYKRISQGFKCKLYRADGSYKDAKVDIDQEYNFRVYKYPDGEIKKKYCVNVKHIRQFHLEFENNMELWKRTVFAEEKGGLFNSHKPDPKNCCSIVGNSRWGEINLINIEFKSVEDKRLFHQCLSYLLVIFRL